MHHKTNHIVAVIALTSYLAMGAISLWHALDHAFRFGTRPYVLTKCKAPTPPFVKAVWTQPKHYPSSARDQAPTYATVTERPTWNRQVSFLAANTRFVARCSSFDLQEESPRAPPQL